MKHLSQEAEELFDHVLQLPPDERESVLARACGENDALRERVAALLRAHDQQPRFLPEEMQDAPGLPGSEGPGTQIGCYKLMEKLGEGGFGAVWAAEQKTPVRRKVALKIIKLGMDTKQVVARFEAERQALALMDHPNIAKVLEAGATDNGRPYFVMELVRGISITKYCDQENLDTVARLELFIHVCQAIQHAHQKGVIHRDIKPSNIMVTLHDGVPVPRVIDFGIAKATQQSLTDKTIYTQYSQFIGTPAYMSPEQAEMSGLDLDTRCDIYSLGVLLYELLTGRTPFDAKELNESGLEEMRRIIREREPQRPSTRLQTLEDADRTTTAAHRSTDGAKLVGLLRGDLDWIILKCLEKDRKRRYETASGLAADVRHYLSDEPVEATPPSARYRMRKLIKRHKGGLAAAASIFSILVVGLAVSLWQTSAATTAREDEAAQRELAESNEKKKTQIAETRRQELYAANVSLAHQAWRDGSLKRAQTLLASQRPKPGETDLRGFEWCYLWWLCQDESRSTLEPFAGSPFGFFESNLVCFSSDGSLLAIAEGRSVAVWNFATGRRIETLESPDSKVVALAFSPVDPSLLAVAGRGKKGSAVHFWNLTGNVSSSFFADVEGVESIAFSPDGKKLAAGRKDGLVEIWEIASRTQVRSSSGHRDPGNPGVPGKPRPALCVTFSPDGELLASAGGDTKVRLWNPGTGEQIGEPLVGHTAYVDALDFSPDGRLLASGGYDSRVLLWEVATKQARPPLLGHKGIVTSVDFSPDGETLVSAGLDQTIRSWDVSSLRQASILRGHTDGVHSVAYSPDGQSLVSCSRSARVWDAPSDRNMETQIEHDTWIEEAALSPDGKTLVASDYHTLALKVWDVPGRSLKWDLVGHTNITTELAFSPDGSLLASGSGYDHTMRLWDMKSGELLETHQFKSDVWSVTFSADSRVLGVASREDGLQFWDIASGSEIELIQGETGSIHRAAFAAEGYLLATQHQSGEVSVWDTRDGSQVTSIHGGKGELRAISRDGQLIALTTGGMITLLDVRQGKIVREIWNRNHGVLSLAFAPDSRTLVSTGFDSEIKFWNIASGQAALTLGHLGPATSVSFSDDGNLMATSGADALVRLWPAASLSEADADGEVASTVPEPQEPEE